MKSNLWLNWPIINVAEYFLIIFAMMIGKS